MPMRIVPLSDTLPKIDWLVKDMIPLSHLSTFYAPAGVGKTRLLSFLATQISRPEGDFLGHAVVAGNTLILDADDPQSYGYQVWLNRFFAGYEDAHANRINIHAILGGLSPEDITSLRYELKNNPPKLIIIDTFASAFLGLDSIKGHYVQRALSELAQLASDLGSAIIVLDHVGKLKKGETVASRGPYGSAKTFAPRAIYALSRVDPRDVDGRDVLRMDCTKASYAPMLAPQGIEIVLSDDSKVARVQAIPLPEGSALDRAQQVMLETLMQNNNEAYITRKDLLAVAVQEVNITTRYAETALKLLVEKHDLPAVNLEGRGSPIAYLYLNSSENLKG